MIVSGVIDAGFQLAANGGDLSKIDGARLAGAMVGGAVAGAITSVGSAVASMCTAVGARGVMVATGAVAGSLGNGVGTVTQNLADNNSSTGAMNNVAESMVVGAVSGVITGARTGAPKISTRAPSYVTNKPVSTSTVLKVGAISTVKELGSGTLDYLQNQGIDAALNNINSSQQTNSNPSIKLDGQGNVRGL
jgi:hypothetical protein